MGKELEINYIQNTARHFLYSKIEVGYEKQRKLSLEYKALGKCTEYQKLLECTEHQKLRERSNAIRNDIKLYYEIIENIETENMYKQSDLESYKKEVGKLIEGLNYPENSRATEFIEYIDNLKEKDLWREVIPYTCTLSKEALGSYRNKMGEFSFGVDYKYSLNMPDRTEVNSLIIENLKSMGINRVVCFGMEDSCGMYGYNARSVEIDVDGLNVDRLTGEAYFLNKDLSKGFYKCHEGYVFPIL